MVCFVFVFALRAQLKCCFLVSLYEGSAVFFENSRSVGDSCLAKRRRDKSCGSGLLYRHESPFSIDVVLQSSIPIRTLLCREYSNERCSLAYCWRGRVSILSLLVYLSFVNQATSTLSNDDRRGRWHQMTLIPKEDRLCQLSNFVAMRSGLDLSFFLTDLWISPFH